VKRIIPSERLLDAPVKAPQELAQLVFTQAEQFRRLARDVADIVIHDELIDLAGRCDKAATAMLSHANGHAGNLTSRLVQKSQR
jgi:hypothetical protein